MHISSVINRRSAGYTLIELVLVILIVGIIATVALKSVKQAIDTARTEETRQELGRIAEAIAGNPALTSGGVRNDYGYVGDVGSLPPNLTALAANPGALATWNGPYLYDPLSDGGTADYIKDAWGKNYAYSAGNMVSSAGGPQTLTQLVAPTLDALLYNHVSCAVLDRGHTPPGTDYQDSVEVYLIYPDGVGGLRRAGRTPQPDGLVQFDSIPIGLHRLEVVYFPLNDTLARMVNVDPGADVYLELQLAEEQFQ